MQLFLIGGVRAAESTFEYAPAPLMISVSRAQAAGPVSGGGLAGGGGRCTGRERCAGAPAAGAVAGGGAFAVVAGAAPGAPGPPPCPPRPRLHRPAAARLHRDDDFFDLP